MEKDEKEEFFGTIKKFHELLQEAMEFARDNNIQVTALITKDFGEDGYGGFYRNNVYSLDPDANFLSQGMHTLVCHITDMFVGEREFGPEELDLFIEGLETVYNMYKVAGFGVTADEIDDPEAIRKDLQERFARAVKTLREEKCVECEKDNCPSHPSNVN